MFNNCDTKTNGELFFYYLIKDKIKVIFDIGSRYDSDYLNFHGEVHYFEPVESFLDQLKKIPNNNSKSVYNNFGLSDETNSIYYYPRYESFYNRINSCTVCDDANKIILNVKRAKDYIYENNIKDIDFIKIDTEGYELNVLKGFDSYIENVNIIQFEYGGTFLDNNTKLIDVVNYLKSYGFHKFSYLTPHGPSEITDFTDHYQYCNIVCLNKHLNSF
jgi:FkbM family methyltransferase